MTPNHENHSLLISVGALLDNKILIVNGQQVLMDWHLAELFEARTDFLLRKVRANIERFPGNFLFVIAAKIFPQTLPPSQRKRRKLYAFTWGGIMQAAGRINTKRAIELHVQLVSGYGKGTWGLLPGE